MFDAGGAMTPGCNAYALPAFAPSPLPAPTGFDGGTVGASDDVSVANDGSPAQYPTVGPGNPNNTELSHRAAISNDGRYVAFESDATNLVADDTNGGGDIFVHDRQTGANQRVDVNSDGSQVTASEMPDLPYSGASLWAPAISADGRYVAFTTAAPLVPSDTDSSEPSWIARQDVYLYDRVTQSVGLVSAMPDGTAAGGAFFSPSISADGRYVAFSAEADATRLPLGSVPATQYDQRIYVRDRVTGTTNLIFDGDGSAPAISADGTTVVFSAVDGACPVTTPQLLAVNLATGIADRIDVATDGTGAVESDNSPNYFAPAVSADGRYVSFTSSGMPGTGGVAPGILANVYVRDRVAGTTTTLSAPLVQYNERSSISGDGSKVTAGIAFFGTWPSWTGAGLGVVNVATGVSTPYGVAGQSYDTHPISGDGRYVAYTHDNYPYGDVYVARIG